MRAAVYARVSTNNGQQSPEMQLTELREFAVRRGWEIAGEFIDHANGAKESRPALNKLLVAAQERKFDVLLCWRLNRVGPSLRHLVKLLAELGGPGHRVRQPA